MPPLAARVKDLLGMELTKFRDVGGQHGYRHVTGTLADGRRVFAKVAPESGEEVADAFAAEANGLRWLAAADGGPLVPQVIGVAADFLLIELLAPLEQATAATARRFGAELARMHAAGAPAFGAPWPGYIASLPLDNHTLDNHAAEADWGSWYAERRIVPYLRRAQDDGALSRADVDLVETVVRRIGELAGPEEPPSRIHGDLWSGNVLWSAGRGCLIDPAAHGGHRETDLAMLALFGAPHLTEILRGYTETAPLADGWRSRVSLHQLHPLLVHVCLFGTGYTAQLRAAARTALGRRNNGIYTLSLVGQMLAIPTIRRQRPGRRDG
jgi:fructosamine-3-kinase